MLFWGGAGHFLSSLGPFVIGWLGGVIKSLESPSGDVVQVAECFPSRREALGSIPSPTLCKAGMWG